jgi:hypothetical protein
VPELVAELRPVKAHQHDRLPTSFRLLLQVMDLFPCLLRFNRLLRYNFFLHALGMLSG